MTDSEFKLEERILCEDDACIGLVGADGRCRECGRKYTGDISLLGTTNPDSVETETPLNNKPGTPDDDVVTTGEDSDVDDRILCPDDTCIGVIGADGHCGTCGKTR